MKKQYIFSLFITLIYLLVFLCLPLSADDTETSEISEIIVDEDMEKLTSGGAPLSDCFSAHTSNEYGSSGSITVITEADGNKCLKYEKNIEGGGKIPHYTDISVSGNGYTVGYDFVIELDFKYEDRLYDCTLVQGRKYDTRLRMQDLIRIVDSRLTDVYGNVILFPVINRWYTISIAMHEIEEAYDIYIDGELILRAVPYANPNAGAELQYTCIRAFNITNMEEKCAIYGDNFKIYNASAPIFEADPEPSEPSIPDTSEPEQELPDPVIPDKPSAIKPSNNIPKLFDESHSDKIFILLISGCGAVSICGCMLLNRKTKS